MAAQAPVIFVLLPAYNEARAVRELLRSFQTVSGRLDRELRLVLVDDGSTDGTADAARSARGDLALEIVAHKENRGLGAALSTGFAHVLGQSRSPDDILICMDADNTHPPGTVPAMVRRIDQGADIVIASRYVAGSRQVGVPLFRRMLSLGARVLFRLLLPIGGVRDFTCGFRAYRMAALRKGWERFGGRLVTTGGFACTDEVLFRLALVTDRISEVPFTLRYDRKPGASNLRLWSTILAQLRVLCRLRRLRREAFSARESGPHLT